MALIGSLDSGVNAMQSFVKGMEVIGDNIANSKTVAFKRQRVNYTDHFSDTLRNATPGTDNLSNLPPTQIGAGSLVASASKIFEQGAIELTGISSDLAISGNGFFRVYDAANDQQLLTRDGSFRIDQNGYLTDKNGFFLLGLTGGTADSDPNIIGKIQVSLADEVKVDTQGRPIDGSGRIVLADGTRALQNASSSTGHYRMDGSGRLLENTLAAFGSDEAIILKNVGTTDARAVLHDDGKYYLTNTSGNYIDETGAEIAGPVSFDTSSPDAAAVEWDIIRQPFAVTGSTLAANAEWDPSSPDPAVGTADPADPDQFRLAIQNWSINRDGELQLVLNDGTSYMRGQILLQQVQDPDALLEEGAGLYSGFVNAGAQGMVAWNVGSTLSDADRADHLPNQSGAGYIQSRALEGSNTDLTQEFADMITTQRAFQAGSKVISVSDEMLQEIINLKR
ncbi:MAG: flagellar hook-basal body complex protein [Puniceicoccaceae bacterium]